MTKLDNVVQYITSDVHRLKGGFVGSVTKIQTHPVSFEVIDTVCG